MRTKVHQSILNGRWAGPRWLAYLADSPLGFAALVDPATGDTRYFDTESDARAALREPDAVTWRGYWKARKQRGAA